MKQMKSLTGLVVSLCLLAGSAISQDAPQTASTGSDRKVLSRGESNLARISKEVRHELVMLPYYSVFDNLAYEVQPDGTVVLHGQVVRPTLKKDSEARIRDIEGVE